MERKGLSVSEQRKTEHGVCINIAPETDMDYAIRLISLEDDPDLPIFTFRMLFLAVGLACFGAVLGQIFVRLHCPFLTIHMAVTNILAVFPSANHHC